LLLDILQGENTAIVFYDVLLPVQWTMSSIMVFLPLKYVLLFMQPFGFLADNMLVWVQLVAYYETKMKLYLWGVVGAVIHVIMLTVGILDPIMGESGIGLSIGSLLLVPFALCYTILAYLYVKSWKEHAIIPYLDLGVHKRDPDEVNVNVVEMVDVHIDQQGNAKRHIKGLVHDAPDVVHVTAKTKTETKPSLETDTKAEPESPSATTIVATDKTNTITERLTFQTKSKSKANLSVDPNKPNIPLGGAKLNTLNLTPAETQTRLKKRRVVWVLGAIVAVLWLLLLSLALKKI
jgi:hypothetical protein